MSFNEAIFEGTPRKTGMLHQSWFEDANKHILLDIIRTSVKAPNTALTVTSRVLSVPNLPQDTSLQPRINGIAIYCSIRCNFMGTEWKNVTVSDYVIDNMQKCKTSEIITCIFFHYTKKQLRYLFTTSINQWNEKYDTYG